MQGLGTDGVVRDKDLLFRIDARKAAEYRREARRIEREEAEEPPNKHHRRRSRTTPDTLRCVDGKLSRKGSPKLYTI